MGKLYQCFLKFILVTILHRIFRLRNIYPKLHLSRDHMGWIIQECSIYLMQSIWNLVFNQPYIGCKRNLPKFVYFQQYPQKVFLHLLFWYNQEHRILWDLFQSYNILLFFLLRRPIGMDVSFLLRIFPKYNIF